MLEDEQLDVSRRGLRVCVRKTRLLAPHQDAGGAQLREAGG